MRLFLLRISPTWPVRSWGRLNIVALVFVTCFFQPGRLAGQSPALSPSLAPSPSQTSAGSLALTATDGGGTRRHLVSHAGLVSQVVVNPNQPVPVTLQFPSDKIGMSVAVGSLDGGEVTSAQPTVLPTGKMLFTFRGSAPGLYRLVVQLPAEQYHLEFYVIDPNRPRRLPRTTGR